jgi:starch phosphorylase
MPTDAQFQKARLHLWRETAHNPVRMLWLVSRDKLEAAHAIPISSRRTTPPSPTSTSAAPRITRGGPRQLPRLRGSSIAYFSAEFALHQSLPIYAGGLGVLAGDHCKEASDLGVPLIGIGFMYPQGYFHQHVSAKAGRRRATSV